MWGSQASEHRVPGGMERCSGDGHSKAGNVATGARGAAGRLNAPKTFRDCEAEKDGGVALVIVALGAGIQHKD